MSKKPAAKPSDAELELLRVLWDRGPSTVREIHDVLAPEKDTGYTTTLKTIQRMTEKGLVRRDESQRSHIYSPLVLAEETQRRLLGDLLQLAFGGSRKKLVLQALSDKKASPEELAEIRRLLDELEAKQTARRKK